MDKKRLIDEYLQGRHPIEQEKWQLPSAGELDRDEALFDTILAENRKASRLGWRFGGGLLAAAAALVVVVALFTWKIFMPHKPMQQAETTEELAPRKDTPKVVEKDDVPNELTKHVKLANDTREVRQRHTRRLKSSQPTIADEPQTSTETPVLANAADSLYYYLTQFENQMGDCRDSTCLAELGNLMQADERIKDLVNKIIHKQVETVFQEEYLVDTTTRYIPL